MSAPIRPQHVLASGVELRDDPSVHAVPVVIAEPHGLVAAVASSAATIPDDFLTFCSVISRIRPAAEFSEHSVRFGAAIEPFRLTHYFDVGSGRKSRATDVGSSFLEAAEKLEFVLPPSLPEVVRRLLPQRDEVAQVVLGIDARFEPGATRLKYYVIFDRSASDAVDAVRAMLGVPTCAGFDPGQAYILGLDLKQSGLSEMKLYTRLDLARLRRVIRNYDEVAVLARGARSVALQQCLVDQERRQLHFHASNAAIYDEWLSRLSSTNNPLSEAQRHARLVESRLMSGRLLPWIIGLEHRNGRVDLSTGNVYFHVTE